MGESSGQLEVPPEGVVQGGRVEGERVAQVAVAAADRDAAVVVPVAVAVFAVVVAVDGVTLAEEGAALVEGGPEVPGGEDEEAPADEVDDVADAVLAEDDGPDGEPEELEAEADPVDGPVEPEDEPELAPEVEAEAEPEVLAEVEPDTDADGETGGIGAAGGMPGASSLGGWTGRSSTVICPVSRANQPPVEMFTRTNAVTGFGAGATMTSEDGWKPVQDLPVYLASDTSAGGFSGFPQPQRTRGTPCASTRTEVPACSTDW